MSLIIKLADSVIRKGHTNFIQNSPFYLDQIDCIFNYAEINYSKYFQDYSPYTSARTGHTMLRSGYLHNLSQDKKEPNDFENSKCLQEMAEHFRERDFGGFILNKFILIDSFEHRIRT